MTPYPFAEAVPPSWEGAQPSSTGEPIFVRRWQPAGEARGAVVIAHGLFEHSGRYLHVARPAGQQGYQYGRWIITGTAVRGAAWGASTRRSISG